MPSVLDDLGLYLEENGLGTLGQTIFLGVIPSEPASFIVITSEYGYDVHYTMEERNMRYEENRLIVLAKDPQYNVAQQKAQQIYVLLGAIHNQNINGRFYLRVSPEHPVYFFEIDAQRNNFLGFYVKTFNYIE